LPTSLGTDLAQYQISSHSPTQEAVFSPTSLTTDRQLTPSLDSPGTPQTSDCSEVMINLA